MLKVLTQKTYPFTDKLRTTNWQSNPVEIHMAKTMFEINKQTVFRINEDLRSQINEI